MGELETAAPVTQQVVARQPKLAGGGALKHLVAYQVARQPKRERVS